MSALLDTLAQTFDQQHMTQLADRLGTDHQTTQKAVSMALPALLTAMNRNTNDPRGAASLDKALQQDHDGSLLDHLSKFLSGGMTGRQADGTGILSHVLGGERDQVERGVAQGSGLDLSSVQRLLPMLAPIVMAALGRQKRQANLSESDLSDMLRNESKRARQAAPSDLLGALGGFFDKDGDGDYKDDLAMQAGRAVLGSLFGR